MKPEIERQLMRLLHGELPEEETAAWESRLTTDEELAAAFERMSELWSGLDLPRSLPAGEEFTAAFWRRREKERSESIVEMWRLAPAWNRVFAAAVLVGGIGLGAMVGGTVAASGNGSLLGELEPTLAETYWILLAENGSEANGEAEE